jgi:hypothetical protein
MVKPRPQMIDLVLQADPNDLVIVLLSGGGSALLPLPAGEISLEEKQQASDALIACGATIHEINTIRKHLSESRAAGWPASRLRPRLPRSSCPMWSVTTWMSLRRGPPWRTGPPSANASASWTGIDSRATFP